MKVVAFNGSSRRDGNTAILLRRVLTELEADGVETELVQLAGKRFAGCTACLQCAEPPDQRCSGLEDDGMNACIEKMVAADGILIGSPTYYANCTATTQALLERSGYAVRKSGNPLARKVGAAVVAARARRAPCTPSTPSITGSRSTR
jgi:multimeric flavodoxin WrbA